MFPGFVRLSWEEPHAQENVLAALMECYCLGKTAERGEKKPVAVPLYPTPGSNPGLHD